MVGKLNLEVLPFKNVDSALEYVDQFFASKKLTKDVHLLGKIVNIQHLPDTDIPTYVIQVSILKGFFRTKLERIFVEAIKHPELDAELEIDDLVSWGASDIKSDVPFGFILFAYDLEMDVSSGQFKHKTVEAEVSSMKLFRFDFGSIAAIEGPLGMIWDTEDGWSPVGGSKELARAVVTDEGSEEIPEDRVESTLLARGAPVPSFSAKDIGQIIKNMPKSDLDSAMSNALAMREYDIDLLYGKILPNSEFLVDGEKYYVSFTGQGNDITVCWNAGTLEWSSGIERSSLEGLSFSSPKLFEQIVFNSTSDENYSKKARLNECLMCGIAVGQTKTVRAKLKTDKLLELSFDSQEWNEILLGNAVRFVKTVSFRENELEKIPLGDYQVDVSNGLVVINYLDPSDEFFEREVYYEEIKNLKGYYS